MTDERFEAAKQSLQTSAGLRKAVDDQVKNGLLERMGISEVVGPAGGPGGLESMKTPGALEAIVQRVGPPATAHQEQPRRLRHRGDRQSRRVPAGHGCAHPRHREVHPLRRPRRVHQLPHGVGRHRMGHRRGGRLGPHRRHQPARRRASSRGARPTAAACSCATRGRSATERRSTSTRSPDDPGRARPRSRSSMFLTSPTRPHRMSRSCASPAQPARRRCRSPRRTPRSTISSRSSATPHSTTATTWTTWRSTSATSTT